jgi:hypothetical protein
VTRALSLAFGLLMVAASAVQADGPALVASAVAVAAMIVGLVFPAAGTLAVVATIVALALSEPSPVVAALAGLTAVAYLSLCHGRGGELTTTLTAPTAVGALGLSVVVMLSTAIPLKLPWIPLVAPLAVVTVYAIVAQSLVAARLRPDR